MKLTDSGIKLLLSVVPFTLPHPSTTNKQWQKHTITPQWNQTELCDYRQKMYLHVSCQNGEYYEVQRVQRVGYMLRSQTRLFKA